MERGNGIWKSARRRELVRVAILGERSVVSDRGALGRMLTTIRSSVQSVRIEAVNQARICALEQMLEIMMHRYWALDEDRCKQQKKELRTLLGGARLSEWSSEQKYRNYKQFDEALRGVRLLTDLARKVDHQCDLKELELAIGRLMLKQRLREVDLEFIRLAYQCLEVRLALKESGWKSMYFRFAGQSASETVMSLAKTS